MTMVHAKLIETRSQKRQTGKDVSKVKDRRQGISAGEKAKACQKRRVDVAYTLWR